MKDRLEFDIFNFGIKWWMLDWNSSFSDESGKDMASINILSIKFQLPNCSKTNFIFKTSETSFCIEEIIIN